MSTGSKKLPPALPVAASGEYARQAHVGVPEGTFEEEHGRNGFFGRVSHLYRRHAPTGWNRIEGNCIPQAFDLNRLDASQSPIAFLENEDVRLAIFKPKGAMPHFYRNADGDDCWFIHRGQGLIETDFGPLNYKKGDYVLLPRGTTYRFYPESTSTESNKDGQFYLLIESAGEYEIPDRGQLGRHAFFDPGVIEVAQAAPSSAGPTHGQEWAVVIKRCGQYTTAYYPFNPLDVVGWKGDLFAWKLNIADIRPIVSPRFHLPPSVHTTLVSRGFVLCTFAPRPMETEDPQAQRVPFFHRNIDYDEVLFYHAGDFFSRSGIGEGFVTFHPQGVHHGPHPKALKNQFTKEYADEYAVMIDTQRPLRPCASAGACEIVEYKNSWKEPSKESATKPTAKPTTKP
jgi:homogentisate 1,2-dioxygenase